MLQALIENLPWVVGLLGLFSFLSVSIWSKEQRREREALYRSDAIKKIAEMGANTPEPVLNLLRESMEAWSKDQRFQPSPAHMGPLQARAYYTNQTLQKIAESPSGGGEAALAFLREQEKVNSRRTQQGLKVGGVITLAVGIVLMIVLRALVPEDRPPVYLAGLIPITVGAILLAASFFTASKE